MLDAVETAQRGPHPVGVMTIEVEDEANPGRVLPIDLWYPAEASVRGRDLDAANGTEHPFGQHHAAVAGARPSTEAFPLLAFSHGNSGLRRQSTFLTTHLASWGFVVAAPDHMGNTFAEMLMLGVEQRKVVHLEARRNRPHDLQVAIASASAGGAGMPAVKTEQIGVLGHSFGGWTALKMPARDARVRAVCGLAPASEPFVGRKAFEIGELPFGEDVATLILAGADDVLVDLDTSVLPLYARLVAPRALVAVDGMDHFHFCDGIDLLHTQHSRTPRDGLSRPVLPLSELLAEARAHRIVRSLASSFFLAVLDGRGDPRAVTGRAAALDEAVRVLG